MRQTDPLEDLFNQLDTLNPDVLAGGCASALVTAAGLPATAFATVAERVRSLVERFFHSRAKINQRTLLVNYFSVIDDQTRKLAAANAGDEGCETDDLSARLLPVRRESRNAWAEILFHADIDESLHRAVDAYANRNEIVETPLATAFAILFAIDATQAFAWTADHMANNPCFADADVLRDLFRVWNDQADIPLSAGCCALALIDDARIAHLWPGMALQVNRLVRRLGLKAVQAKAGGQSKNWGYLAKSLAQGSGAGFDAALERWLDAATEQIGRHIASFIACAGRIDAQETDERLRQLAKRQAFTDVRAVDALYPAIMLGADLFLKRADGAHVLALAFLGVDRSHLRAWRAALHDKAARLVRSLFLADLHNRRDALETIRTFCLGDDMLQRALQLKVDLLSRQFSSLADREAVVDVLAANYASFREVAALKQKIAWHYRRLVKLLHEDSLRHLLPSEEVARLDQFDHLALALARASEARRYLDGRRALETSLEDMCAAEWRFEQDLHAARAALLRQALIGKGVNDGNPGIQNSGVGI